MNSEDQKNIINQTKLIKDCKIAIVASPYYSKITSNLISGAIKAISSANIISEIFKVEGALEIPGAISLIRKDFQGFVALGCVIRGETIHYEIVSQNSAMGLMQLSTQGLCIGNGIITVENINQALERSDPNKKDKGGDAARAAISLMSLRQEFYNN